MTGRPEDPRPRAAKRPDGRLAKRIAAVPPHLRAGERAAIHAESGAPGTWQAERGGVTYTLSVPRVERRKKALFVPTVICDPAPPIPVDATGYYFVNPPVRVPDGTVYPGTDGYGNPALLPNYVEDPATAMRTIIADCVLRGG